MKYFLALLLLFVCASGAVQDAPNSTVASLQGLNKSLDKLDEVLSIKRDSAHISKQLRIVQENK